MRALVSPQKGADLLAMGAAALAAVSVVFQERDPGYSQELLDTAQSLYLQVRFFGNCQSCNVMSSM